jgi:predicted SprT family Zn-dependent metalloprotease
MNFKKMRKKDFKKILKDIENKSLKKCDNCYVKLKRSKRRKYEFTCT